MSCEVEMVRSTWFASIGKGTGLKRLSGQTYVARTEKRKTMITIDVGSVIVS